MSTDRELLELAAKAAGAKWSEYSDQTPDQCIIQHVDGVWRPWAPLTDDGDALRLAVQLKFSIDVKTCCCAVEQIGPVTCPAVEIFHDDAQERLASTRRAIVRAAAEIGKAMP